MLVHSTDAFRHATQLAGTEIWSFCQHAQFDLQKEECCFYSVVEKNIVKLQKKTEWHTRGLDAQFIDFCTP